MNGLDIYIVHGLAALAANLPFWGGRRRFFGLPLFREDKGFGWVLLEWMIGFGLWMTISLGLESRLQPIHAQNWQFWVVSVCLFVLFAVPGFVVRYLWAPRKR